jgi:glycine cleavage system H lipoate-binding protein
MMPHDIITLYSAKAIEYLMAVGFLLLFIPFWRYVTGSAVAAPAHESLTARLTHWFHVPANTFFHPGHAWARPDGSDLVTVGMDDFAQKLIGAPAKLDLPPVGARLVQGEPGWAIRGDHKSVDMLSPVGGIVVEVNQEAVGDPSAVNRDPYGQGWLLRLRAPRAAAHLATLRANDVARRWMDRVCESMTATLTPALGHVSQDGGVPVEGLARIVAGDHWDQMAREYLLTDTGPALEADGPTPVTASTTAL